MLYIVGLGLGGEHGITVRGLDAVRRCARIYMEARTALLTFGVDGDPSSRLTKLVRVTFSVSPLDDPILALLLSGARRRLSRKGIRCSSAACSWATDRWACMCGAHVWACMCGAHVSGTPLQGTQLQRISFRGVRPL